MNGYQPRRNAPSIREHRVNDYLSPIARITAKHVSNPTAIQSLVTVKSAPGYSKTQFRISKTLKAADPEFSWPKGNKGDNDAKQYTPAIIVDDDARDPGPNGMPKHVRFCTNGLHASQIWDVNLGTRAHFMGMVIASRTEEEVYGANDGTTAALNYGATGVHGMLPLEVHGTLDFINFSIADIEMNDTLMWAPQPINNDKPPIGDGVSDSAYRIGLIPLPRNLRALLMFGDTYYNLRLKMDPIFAYINHMHTKNLAQNANQDARAAAKAKVVDDYVRHAHACRVGKSYKRAAPGEVGLVFVVPH